MTLEDEPVDPAAVRLENNSLRGELAAVHDDLRTLRGAVETRQLTGQATEIVAAQLGLGTQQAWEVLRQVSSLTNRKIRLVAAVFVAAHDGTLDQLDDVCPGQPENSTIDQPTDPSTALRVAQEIADALPIALRRNAAAAPPSNSSPTRSIPTRSVSTRSMRMPATVVS